MEQNNGFQKIIFILFLLGFLSFPFFPLAFGATEQKISVKDIFLLSGDNNRARGIDVSRHQGDINWVAVADANYKFAFAKATEGVDFNDPRFMRNMRDGNAAGLLMGPYHFATPYTDGVNDANAEACDFVERIRPYLRRGFLRPVLDLERGDDLDNDTLSNWVHDFMNTVFRKTGIMPLLYVNSNYANNELNDSVTIYDLWIAHYIDKNGAPNTGMWDGNWVFWQYTDEGNVPGIDGNVDLDLFDGNMDELMVSSVVIQTNNRPPTTPNSPVPEDGDNNVSPGKFSRSLHWSGGDPHPLDNVRYDVFFGTVSSPPLVQSNWPYTDYWIGSLASNTTYYWRIVARDSSGVESDGPLWSFTTLE